ETPSIAKNPSEAGFQPAGSMDIPVPCSSPLSNPRSCYTALPAFHPKRHCNHNHLNPKQTRNRPETDPKQTRNAAETVPKRCETEPKQGGTEPKQRIGYSTKSLPTPPSVP